MSAQRSKILVAMLFSLLIVLILPIGFVGRDSRAETSNVLSITSVLLERFRICLKRRSNSCGRTAERKR